MAEIRNSNFNNGTLSQATFISDGSKPSNFTGLTSESAHPDHELGDLPHPDLASSEDAPAAAFVKRLVRNASKDLDVAAQGAGNGKTAKSGEQQGRDQASSGAKGKQEGQAADRHDGGPALNRNGTGKDGAAHGGSSKDKHDAPTSSAKQGNTQASTRGSDPSHAALRNGNAAANPGGAGRGTQTIGTGQFASQMMGRMAGGTAPNGNTPMPGATLPQAAGAMLPSASAHAAAASLAGAANQAAAAPRGLFTSQRPGNTSKRSGASGTGSAAAGGGEDGADEIFAASISGCGTQAPVTGKQTSDSDTNDSGGDTDGSPSGDDRAAGAAGNMRGRRKREATGAPDVGPSKRQMFASRNYSSGPDYSAVSAAEQQTFTGLAAQALKGSTDSESGTVGSYGKLKGILGQLKQSMPSDSDKDSRFPDLQNQLKLLEKFLEQKEKRRTNSHQTTSNAGRGGDGGGPLDPEDTGSYPSSDPTPDFDDTDPNGYVSSADPKLAAAIATGDVFEIVYAIMAVMFAGATENTRQRALRVRQLNSDQEQIRSAQNQVRILDQGFKPGADGSTKLKDKKDGTSDADLAKQIKATQDALNDIGWDPATYCGGKGLSPDTSKQQLDDLIANMDSSLTSYNNMNSLETNDLTREAQAAQAYLTGMNGILSKENQALNSIAGSLGR
ncbi:hypothetical protein [Bordetella sp. LUAb4]|uniref:hypothetical protein n=1 Tax=Bordetella sp. LUAb4 TaxID=2843195 RepID=UPI001E44FAE2|nr:hypothetical protein [Bordetella sp. LUAb4]